MGKIATDIEEQIDLLAKRGMLFSCREKAKEYLLDIGYYRLGFYWHYFECNKEHQFSPDTNIESIRELYYFDFDLKYLLSKFIYRIEVHFRTQMVYWVSVKYKSSPTWYIDNKYVADEMVSFIKKLYYRNNGAFIKNNKYIKKHHTKYSNSKYAPAWKTLEFFTFGQMNKLFRNLNDNELKKHIAEVYGYKNLDVFSNHLSSIVNIRNICSHNGVLFDYNQPIGIKKIPNEKFQIKSRNQTNLNASISVVLNILETISKNRSGELKENLNSLISKTTEKVKLKNIIQNKIGYEII